MADNITLPVATKEVGGFHIQKVTLTDSAGDAVEAATDYISVRLTDGTSFYGAGGGTQFAEDSAHASGDMGTMALAVRRDTGSSLAGTDGDYAPLQLDSSGNLRVTIASGGGTTQYAEDASHASGDSGTLALVVRRDTVSVSSGTDGDYSTLNVSSTGRLWCSATIDAALPAGTNAIGKLVANSGVTIGAVEIAASQTLATVTTVGSITSTVNVADGGGSLTVDAPVGTPVFVRLSDGSSAITTLPVSIASGATSIAKAEDVASADADVGVPAMAVRKATPANTSGADGDYEFLQMSAGRLWVSATIDAALPAGTNAIGTVSLNPTSGNGWSIHRTLSAASTNATSVKGSAGSLGGWYLFNAGTAQRYLKLYNKASSPTVGTDTPVMTIPIPSGAAANVEFANGIAFGTGIAFALTTGIADADTGAVAANDIVVNLLYK